MKSNFRSEIILLYVLLSASVSEIQSFESVSLFYPGKEHNALIIGGLDWNPDGLTQPRFWLSRSHSQESHWNCYFLKNYDNLFIALLQDFKWPANNVWQEMEFQMILILENCQEGTSPQVWTAIMLVLTFDSLLLSNESDCQPQIWFECLVMSWTGAGKEEYKTGHWMFHFCRLLGRKRVHLTQWVFLNFVQFLAGLLSSW